MFDGFSPEAIDFLWGIRMNNNREWFQAHKQTYVSRLYEPMKALGQDLFSLIADRPGDLLKVSRIYRDARLHHPVPYKESLWICIRKDVQWWEENPCLFFEIRPEVISYGFVWWSPKAATMEAFRQQIAAQPGPFLRLLEKTREDTGIAVTASCYKRPKPTDQPEIAPYFAWKNNISCICSEEISPAVFGPELGERVKVFLRKLLPLYDCCNCFYQ